MSPSLSRWPSCVGDLGCLRLESRRANGYLVSAGGGRVAVERRRAGQQGNDGRERRDEEPRESIGGSLLASAQSAFNPHLPTPSDSFAQHRSSENTHGNGNVAHMCAYTYAEGARACASEQAGFSSTMVFGAIGASGVVFLLVGAHLIQNREKKSE